MLIDGKGQVEKRIKPGRAQFQIQYRSRESYEPDFVVEIHDRILLGEIKARDELKDPPALVKTQAAVKWCRSYLLIPDDWITGAVTLQGLRAIFTSN